MPDLDTLIERAARQGAHPDRLRAARPQLVEQMRRSELANFQMSAVGLVIALAGIGGLGLIAWLVVWAFHAGLTQFSRFPHVMFWITYGVIILVIALGVGLFRPRLITEKRGASLIGALIGIGILGVATWLALWAIHSGLTRGAPFPHGACWITYGAVILTLTLGVSILRPRSMYGTQRGPYTIAEDPLFWRDGPIGEMENILRLTLALPNLLRMSLYNLLSVSHLRRLGRNGDLALFVLLAADKRIVAEEILIVQKKKRAADLWSVVAALGRMEFLRYERLRHELVIWRGQAAERMLGIISD